MIKYLGYIGCIVCVFCGVASLSPAQTIDDIILMSEQFPPYNFEQDGKLQGIAIDVVARILEQLHSKQRREDIQILPWSRSYQLLQKEKNTALFSMTRTPAREDLFKWVGPLSTGKNVLIAKKDRKIRVASVEDLQAYKIGAVRHDAGEQLAQSLGVKAEMMDITTDARPNIRKLAIGRIDLFAYDENVAKWLMAQEGLNPNDFESVYLLAESVHYIGFHKETPDALILQVQAALDEIKASGEYEKILAQYLQ